MSRIGKLPIAIPDGVDVSVKDSSIEVKGPKGTLNFDFKDSAVSVAVNEGNVIVENVDDSKEAKALWGTTRACINNMVEGVTNGFKKSLEINWVGYKFEISWKTLVLSVGFSHKVEVPFPNGIEIALDEKAKNIIHITGVDKQAVGECAAKIRAYKKPEPYKGKGIKYVWEYIRRKAGKTGK